MKKRLISIICALTLCLSVLGGCGEETTNDGVTKVSFDGTHVFTATDTEDYIVKDGATDYSIVIPAADRVTKYAKKGATELITFFKQATGLTLNLIYEEGEGFTHDASKKYISIGYTKMFESSGLTAPASVLKSQGARIVTLGKTIYMFGGGDQGNLYAVYDFLSLTLNYEYYHGDTWTIDEGVTELKLKNFDVTDVPDMEVRSTFWGYVSMNSDYGYRFRAPSEAYIMPVGDVERGASRTTFHNTSEIFVNGEKEWYSDNGEQLCYTAHGDDDSYERMVERGAYVLERSLIDYPREQYPNYKLFTISMEDNSGTCGCSACRAAKEKYTQDSGAVIKFCNDVMAAVNEWWDLPENEPYKRENFYLMFFAYGSFVNAPTVKNAEGKYEPAHRDCALRDDVGAYLAANNINYFKSIYDEANATQRENVLAWFDIAPATFLWLYQINFSFYPSMFDTYRHFNAEGYNFYASGKPLIFQNQATFNAKDVTAFQGLNVYLESKLSWNSSLDSDELTENWFKAMFGAASDVMRRLFLEERVYTTSMYEKLGTLDSFSFLVTVNRSDCWPLPVLNRWLDLLDEAREINRQINYKNNPEAYELIETHIDKEFVFPGYCLLLCYSKEEAGPRFVETVKRFKSKPDLFSGYVVDQSASRISSVWADLDVD